MPFECLDDVLAAALTEIRKYLKENGIMNKSLPEAISPGEEASIFRMYIKEKAIVVEKVWTFVMDGKITLSNSILLAKKQIPSFLLMKPILYAKEFLSSSGDHTIVISTQDPETGVIETYIHSEEKDHFECRGRYKIPDALCIKRF
jgi:hypothetical protein